MRIVRVANEMNLTMRIFCYTFILGISSSSALPVKVGKFTFDQQFIENISVLVLVFIIVDLVTPVFRYLTLQIVHLVHFNNYKKLDIQEGDYWIENKDSTEKIIKPACCEIALINMIPECLNLGKIIVTALILCRLIGVFASQI